MTRDVRSWDTARTFPRSSGKRAASRAIYYGREGTARPLKKRVQVGAKRGNGGERREGSYLGFYYIRVAVSREIYTVEASTKAAKDNVWSFLRTVSSRTGTKQRYKRFYYAAVRARYHREVTKSENKTCVAFIVWQSLRRTWKRTWKDDISRGEPSDTKTRRIRFKRTATLVQFVCSVGSVTRTGNSFSADHFCRRCCDARRTSRFRLFFNIDGDATRRLFSVACIRLIQLA